MPSQPAVKVDLPLRRQEWDLLVHLPRRVLVAATAGSDRVDAVAGIEAIAAGHRARSLVVRGVVAAIFAEQQPERVSGGPDTDPPYGRAEVLAECHRAARLLDERLGADDASAYGRWLLTIAASVGAAAWQSRTVTLGGIGIHIAERLFVRRLAEEFRRALRR